MNALTIGNVISILLARRIRERCLLLLLLCSLATATAGAPTPAVAAGHPPQRCATRPHHKPACPARHQARTGRLYTDGYGDYLYVDPSNRVWLLDASGHLYFVDPYHRIWYVAPDRTFWYAAPDNSFWYYVAPDGEHGYVYPSADGYSGYAGAGYVDPTYGSGTGSSTDPRWSSDANGNWVTSLPGGSGVNDTIGYVDGCVTIGDEHGGTGC